jgi:hypothetical protein
MNRRLRSVHDIDAYGCRVDGKVRIQRISQVTWVSATSRTSSGGNTSSVVIPEVVTLTEMLYCPTLCQHTNFRYTFRCLHVREPKPQD